MSRSGRKFRDPFNEDARKRKGGPIDPDKQRLVEELRQQELDDELQDMWHKEYHKVFDGEMMESKCFREEE